MTSVLFGAPSCRRIISASTPPRQKKTNVVTMYMIPIRLWSVVVIQLVQPRASRSARVGADLGDGGYVGGHVVRSSSSMS